MENKPVKNFLKRIRENKNLTQDQLAEASGVARYIISEFENEKRRPTPRTISRLSEALDCSYMELMTGEKKTDEEKKKNLSQNRQNYLEEAVNLTRKHCSGQGYSEELMMKVSGHLSYLIEEYESASSQERKEILKNIEDQKAKLLADNIFLNTKVN